MNTNIETIEQIITYIEEHLDEDLSYDMLAKQVGYSKYHLSRMFESIVGFTMHVYIQRRRLSEAARQLVYTTKPVLEIALQAGYETQQSFHAGFKAFYKVSPQAYRKKNDYFPIQLKFTVDGNTHLRGDQIINIRIEKKETMCILAYKIDTRFRLFTIGKTWKRLHKNKYLIKHRMDMDFLIGLNDYTYKDLEKEEQKVFDYYAGVEVSKADSILKGMIKKEVAANTYLVFRFHARCEDSLEPVADYIYKVWFPTSNIQLHEDARFDFAKYGEQSDTEGKSVIEYWVPIKE